MVVVVVVVVRNVLGVERSGANAWPPFGSTAIAANKHKDRFRSNMGRDIAQLSDLFDGRVECQQNDERDDDGNSETWDNDDVSGRAPTFTKPSHHQSKNNLT